MRAMFFIGCAIFVIYFIMVVRAIIKGHKTNKKEKRTDLELRNYYVQNNKGFVDYDGIGNQGRFPSQSN